MSEDEKIIDVVPFPAISLASGGDALSDFYRGIGWEGETMVNGTRIAINKDTWQAVEGAFHE